LTTGSPLFSCLFPLLGDQNELKIDCNDGLRIHGSFLDIVLHDSFPLHEATLISSRASMKLPAIIIFEMSNFMQTALSLMGIMPYIVPLILPSV
jgi:hypothetical protein